MSPCRWPSPVLHRLIDPDAGDTLLVVTAPPPIRGFIKRQDFVELSLLESMHGVAVHPNSEDVIAEVGADKIILGRPGGLTLSSADVSAERATAAVRPMFDVDEWRKNREENFFARQDALIDAAGAAAPGQRTPARLNLARFYMARGMYPEAKGVADLALSDTKPGSEDPAVLMVHAVASILIGRPEQGAEGPRQSRDRHQLRFAAVEGAGLRASGQMGGSAREIQERRIRHHLAADRAAAHRDAEAMRASLEVRDYSGAARRRSDLEVIGIPAEMKPAMAVLRGRLAEALGHDKDARANTGLRHTPRPRRGGRSQAARITLRQKRDEISQADCCANSRRCR